MCSGYCWFRDGKSLQNSTGKTLILKNLRTKYVRKMLKNVQKFAKIPKNCTKKAKPFEKSVKKTKISTDVKN